MRRYALEFQRVGSAIPRLQVYDSYHDAVGDIESLTKRLAAAGW